MPTYIRLLGRYGNGIAALVFGALFVAAGATGQTVPGLLCLFLVSLAAFNIYVIEKSAAMTTEEEWLKGELRKAELRQKLAAMAGETPETTGRDRSL